MAHISAGGGAAVDLGLVTVLDLALVTVLDLVLDLALVTGSGRTTFHPA